MPQTVRETLAMLSEEIDRLDERLGTADASLNARHKANASDRAPAQIDAATGAAGVPVGERQGPAAIRAGFRSLDARLGG